MASKWSTIGSKNIWLGIFLLGTAALVLGMSQSIRAIGLGENFDPGPKAFPIGLSIILIIGGVIECFQKKAGSDADASDSKNGNTVLFLLSLFVLYVVLLPWLGFALSTAIAAPSMMRLLGNSWKSSAIVSAVLIGVIYLLFVLLFKVPLPGGVLGMPF